MGRAEFLKMFRDCVLEGSIEIRVDVSPEYAQGGDGKWNKITTTVFVADEKVIETRGEFDIIDPV